MPPIPESLKATLTPKLLGKLVNRMRSRPDLHMETIGAAEPFPPHLRSSAEETRLFPHRTHKLGIRPRASNPELNADAKSSLCHDLASLRLKSGFGSKYALHDMQSSEQLPETIDIPLERRCVFKKDKCSSKVHFTVAKPRLSPMEYARMYLIDKSLAKRQERPCQFPTLEKQCFWTPRWEMFLIIPRIPPAVLRNTYRVDFQSSETRLPVISPTDGYDSDEDSIATVKADTPVRECPRLSLQLGQMTGLMPSVLNLVSMENDTATPREHESLTHLAERLIASNMNNNTNRLEAFVLNQTMEDKRDLELMSNDVDADKLSISSPASLLIGYDAGSGLSSPMNELQSSSYATETRSAASFYNESSPLQELNRSPTESEVPRSRSSDDDAMDSPYLANEETNEGVDSSSVYSQESVDTVILRTPEGSLRLMPDERQTKAVTNSFLTPSTPPCHQESPSSTRAAVDYSPASFPSSSESAKSLARFPTSHQEDTRLTPTSFAQRIIHESQGCVRGDNSSQRARLVENMSANRLEAYTADYWDSVSNGPMVPELAPAPLKLRKHEPVRHKEEGRQSSWPWRSQAGLDKRNLEDCGKDDQGMMKASRTDIDRAQLHLKFKNGLSRGLDINSSCTPFALPEPDSPTRRRESSTTTMHYGPRRHMSMPEEGICAIPLESNESLHSKKPNILQPKLPDSPTLPKFEGEFYIGESVASQKYQKQQDKARESSHERDVKFNGKGQQHNHLVQSPTNATTMPPSRRSKGLAMVRRVASKESIFSLNKNKARGAMTILPRLADNERDVEGEAEDTAQVQAQRTSAESDYGAASRYTSLPIDGVSRFSLQRFDTSSRLQSSLAHRDMSLIRETPNQPPDYEEKRHVSTQHTLSSSLGGLFRKRSRPQLGNMPSTPKTLETLTMPTTPTTHWRPFDEPMPAPPCSSPWLFGGEEDATEREQRAVYFRERTERRQREELESRSATSGRSSRASSNTSKGNGPSALYAQAGQRENTGELVDRQATVNRQPLPPQPTSPLPPVPDLTAAINNDAQRSYGARVSGTRGPGQITQREDYYAATYKTKKPRGLKVETNKLRKQSRENMHSTWGSGSSSSNHKGSTNVRPGSKQ